MDELIDVLASVEIFQDLDRDRLATVAARCRRDVYCRNQTIVGHGDATCDVYFIKSGRVGISMYSQTGKEILFRQLAPGDMFGAISAIDNAPRSASAVSLSAVELVRMSDGDFRDMLAATPEVGLRVMRHLAFLVRSLSERIFEFTTFGVRNRIHAELLRLAKAHMTSATVANIYPSPTHADIASQVSTHREAVSREFGYLTSEGILKKRGRNLIVRDVPRLEALVREVGC
jgi:CRP-like cAMP-binding protein